MICFFFLVWEIAVKGIERSFSDQLLIFMKEDAKQTYFDPMKEKRETSTVSPTQEDSKNIYAKKPNRICSYQRLVVKKEISTAKY